MLVAVEIWLCTLCTWLLTLWACCWACVTAVEAWLRTLWACEATLLIALLALEVLLLPHPTTATPAMKRAVATAMTATRRSNLLDWRDMSSLLLKGCADALQGALY